MSEFREDLVPAQLAEWEAWQDYCKELRKIIPDMIDINGEAFDPMMNAIRRWGEKLVRLRVLQTDDERVAAYREHEEKYVQ